MNQIIPFFIEVLLTVGISLGTFFYLRPFLTQILSDLCGTTERAKFWTIFCGLILIGFPFIISLAYHPEATMANDLFFEIIRRTSKNLSSFLFVLIGIGLVLAVTSLVSAGNKSQK